jgi:hypothetical protein
MLSGIDGEVLLRRAKLWWGAEQGRIRVPRNAMIFAQNKRYSACEGRSQHTISKAVQHLTSRVPRSHYPKVCSSKALGFTFGIDKFVLVLNLESEFAAPT